MSNYNKFQEEIKMKSNKIILAVFILSMIALIFSGCGNSGTTPNITQNGSISGRIMVPDNIKKGAESWTQPLAGASVDTTDSKGIKHIATTDNDGYYTIFEVAPGYNYIVTAEGTKKGNTIVLKDVAEEIKEGENYNAGVADAESTTLALVLEYISQQEPDLDIPNINTNDIKECDGFNEAKNVVSNTIELGGNILTTPEVSISVSAVNTANAIIDPNKVTLWGYLYTRVEEKTYSSPVVGGYVYAINKDGEFIGWSQTFPADYPTYNRGWWKIENLPVGEEFTLVGFHPSNTYKSAIVEYTITEPGYQKFKYNGGEFYIEYTTYIPGEFWMVFVIVDIIEDYFCLPEISDDELRLINNKFLSYIGYFNEEEEEQKIIEVGNQLNSALENLDFKKARSYCVYNSEARNQVIEIEEQFNELKLFCDNINIDVEESSDSEITIEGILAKVSSSSGSVAISCTPADGEELSSTAGREGESFFEKTENGWKIYKISMTDFVTVSDTNQPPVISGIRY